jgi:hypothetical protein
MLEPEADERRIILMVDDFWGEQEWQSFTTELRRAFPDREPASLLRWERLL